MIAFSPSTVAANPPAWQTTIAGTRTIATNMSEPCTKSVQHTAMYPPMSVYETTTSAPIQRQSVYPVIVRPPSETVSGMPNVEVKSFAQLTNPDAV